MKNKENVKDKVVVIRISQSEKEAIKQKAKKDNTTLSKYIIKKSIQD